jgi:hypothetical protein
LGNLKNEVNFDKFRRNRPVNSTDISVPCSEITCSFGASSASRVKNPA